jgi:hypothetical protein
VAHVEWCENHLRGLTAVPRGRRWIGGKKHGSLERGEKDNEGRCELRLVTEYQFNAF